MRTLRPSYQPFSKRIAVRRLFELPARRAARREIVYRCR